MSKMRRTAKEIRGIVGNSIVRAVRGKVEITARDRFNTEQRIRLAEVGERDAVPIKLKGSAFPLGGEIRSVAEERRYRKSADV